MKVKKKKQIDSVSLLNLYANKSIVNSYLHYNMLLTP